MSGNEQEYAELERAVGVREGFFHRLVDEDDWSFVIKLHALFEAACAHLLLFHFREPELADIVARLELSNKTKERCVKNAIVGSSGGRICDFEDRRSCWRTGAGGL
jgi:hypothetical protein